MNPTVSSVLKRLREENPELLKDIPEKQLKEFNLENLDPDMPPSEMKKLADAIARKRLTAPGLSNEESAALLRRLGLKK